MDTLAVSKAVTPLLPKVELPFDRRKNKRYEVKEGALICPVARQRKYWKMLDVSMGGASFRYIPYEDLNAFNEIDIATQNVDFALEGIPFKVISDCELTDCPSSLDLRRCGVEFGPLTNMQKSLLEEFIRNYFASVRQSLNPASEGYIMTHKRECF
jgi:hypothetical protein